MRLYLAGPMSGIPDLNYPAFHAEAARLRALGYHVENPAENPVPECGTWVGYMKMAIAQVISCDALVCLPGWSKSKGATLEVFLASRLKMKLRMAADVTESELPLVKNSTVVVPIEVPE
jgi:hypothetical protein